MEVPTWAMARISRGKETFFTIPAWATSTPAELRSELLNKFQGSSPANR